MVFAYCTIFIITFLIVSSALLKDDSADKRSAFIWLFVLVTALIWPITLPFIISSKLRTYKERSQRSSTESQVDLSHEALL